MLSAMKIFMPQSFAELQGCLRSLKFTELLGCLNSARVLPFLIQTDGSAKSYTGALKYTHVRSHTHTME